MKSLFTEEEYKKAKDKSLLPCQCYQCDKTFYKKKCVIRMVLNNKKGCNGKYCSKECMSAVFNLRVSVNCLNCNTTFKKKKVDIKRWPNNFCSQSCSTTYNNKNKKHGYRRSKLEVYLEEELTRLYPELEIHFNRKDTINSELDFYIPSLKLAFELNGIFHYEPIFGEEQLKKIENNDKRKFQACLEKGIELCIIDSSKQSYFKPSTSKKYLDIIITILNEKLSVEQISTES